MARSRRRCIVYRDLPGDVAWVDCPRRVHTFRADQMSQWHWQQKPPDDEKVALGVALGMVKEDEMREPHAMVLLRLLSIVDGVIRGGITESERVACAALCTLSLRRRALLYYVCCDRLGYDPAESDCAPERM